MPGAPLLAFTRAQARSRFTGSHTCSMRRAVKARWRSRAVDDSGSSTGGEASRTAGVAGGCPTDWITSAPSGSGRVTFGVSFSSISQKVGRGLGGGDASLFAAPGLCCRWSSIECVRELPCVKRFGPSYARAMRWLHQGVVPGVCACARTTTASADFSAPLSCRCRRDSPLRDRRRDLPR
jgi:hypothetical protein